MGHLPGSLSANSPVAPLPISDERNSLFNPHKRRSILPFACYQFASDASPVTATTESHAFACYLKIDIPYSRRNSAKSILSRKSARKLPAIPSSIEEFCSSDTIPDQEHEFTDSSQDLETRPPSADQLTAMLLDSERANLLRKLSEANQQNRSLKRQVSMLKHQIPPLNPVLKMRSKEETLITFKRNLSSLEMEMQALITMAEEISQCGIPEGSRRINGKFIQTHLVTRLEALHQKLVGEAKGVETALCKEVTVLWYGMAESVIVMGTFDEWCEGKHLSKDYDGSGNTFTGKLMLQPGRYEIKFLVDGEWHLSPEYPSVGEGLTKNNLLLVR